MSETASCNTLSLLAFSVQSGLAVLRGVAVAASAAALTSCGGGNLLSNPPSVNNTAGATSGQELSFDFYQQCINPIFEEALPIVGTGLTNTCSASGCHDSSTGSTAFRVVRSSAQVTDFSAPDLIRQGESMYKNYISALRATTVGDPSHSRLLNKPRLNGVLFHGGGLVFDDPANINPRLIEYWISNPVPSNQDEFSNAIPIVKDGSGKCTL